MVALVGEHMALKRQGRRWVGLCPFHAEKTPSFSVNAEQGLYYCFGCQASGDAISFIRAVEHLDFVEAVERLADRVGITLDRQEGGAVTRQRLRRRALSDTLEKGVAWYHDRLISHPDAGRARDYLRSRGYDGEVVRAFRLGWAPDEWDALAKHLSVGDAVLRESGLGFVNRRGKQQDAMRARVIFPIFDPGGRAVALGGRVLPGTSGEGGGGSEGGPPGPKYKNSPETALYSKRRVLYGLNWAKGAIVDTGEVIVCEGYTDVIAFFQTGIPRAVATCGTALAEEHFELLKNFAKRVVLAYDADIAGRAAAARFYEWERRHDLDIAVAALPQGSDPAELFRTGPDALAGAVSSARPFLQFRVEQVMGATNLATAEGRARAAEAAMSVIVEHPNELVRDQYLMSVADRTRIDPQRLRAILTRLSGRGKSRSSSEQDRRGGGTAGRVVANPGAEALRLAIHRPEEMASLEEVLFTDPLQRVAFHQLAEATTLHEAIDRADPEVGELLRRLAVEETEADPADVVGRLVAVAAARALAELESESRVSEVQLQRTGSSHHLVATQSGGAA